MAMALVMGLTLAGALTSMIAGTLTLNLTLIMTRAMTMGMAVVMGVIQRQVRATATPGIGAGFGFEGTFLIAHRQPQAAQHGVQDMVVLIAEPASLDAQGHMAITQVVAGPGQQQGVRAGRHGQAFRGGPHPDGQALRAGQQITFPQAYPPRQEEPGLAAIVQLHPQAALDPTPQGQGQGGNRRGVPGLRPGQEMGQAYHRSYPLATLAQPGRPGWHAWQGRLWRGNLPLLLL
jgi:hypothetical protein